MSCNSYGCLCVESNDLKTYQSKMYKVAYNPHLEISSILQADGTSSTLKGKM